MTAAHEAEPAETPVAESDERTTLNTTLPHLRLVELTPDDAQAYYDLVDRNRTHLIQRGDYLDLGKATPESLAAELSDPQSRNIRFGVWLDDHLIGRVDLNPHSPGNVVLGYWLGREYTGKGYATVACRALIDYGKIALGARTAWAGVTKGNTKSEAVLARLGFQAVSDQGTY